VKLSEIKVQMQEEIKRRQEIDYPDALSDGYLHALKFILGLMNSIDEDE